METFLNILGVLAAVALLADAATVIANKTRMGLMPRNMRAAAVIVDIILLSFVVWRLSVVL